MVHLGGLEILQCIELVTSWYHCILIGAFLLKGLIENFEECGRVGETTHFIDWKFNKKNEWYHAPHRHAMLT